MTPDEYKHALTVLGLNHVTVAEVLGVTERQSYRWAAGATPVPTPVALVLLTCIATDTFPEQLVKQAEATAKALRRADAA